LCIDVREPYLNHIINTICNSANHNLISIIMTKKRFFRREFRFVQWRR